MRKLTALVCAGMLWGIGALVAQEPPNLVANGNFEADADGDGMADDWQFSGHELVKVEWSREEGHDGERCQRLTCTSFEHVSGYSHAMLCQVNHVQVEKGKGYRLSFWARGEGIRQRSVSVALSKMGEWQNLGLQEAFVPTAEWKRFEFDFRAADTATDQTRLQFWFNSVGTLYLDDVVLVQGEPRPERRLEVVRDLGGKNRVPNSSFECGSAGWGSFAEMPTWAGGPNRLMGETDAAEARLHEHSLKIALTPETIPVFYFDWFRLYRHPVTAPLLASRGWLDVKRGGRYTLSAWMKADRPGLKGQLGIVRPARIIQQQEVDLGTEWGRYEYTFEAPRDQIYVALGLDLAASEKDTGTVWIDGVQLEEGPQATDWEPRAQVEIGVEWEQPGRLFDIEDEPSCTLIAFNSGEEQANFDYDLHFANFLAPEAEPAHTDGVVPPQTRLPCGQLLRGNGRRGHYSFTVSSTGCAVCSHAPERYAVIEKYQDDDSAFGMNHAYPWPELLDYSKQFGLLWFRDWSLKWHDVEPQPGQFTFVEPDYQIDRVLERGINVLPLLPFPSSNWASTAPPADDEQGEVAMRERAAWMPKDLDAFGQYVQTTVRHYRDRLGVWEIMNEPIYTSYALPGRAGYKVEDYVRLLEVAYKAVKAADPEALVIGGIAGHPTTYTKEFIEAGGLQWVDALNLHAYPGMTPPELYDDPMRKLREQMKAAGAPKPIWFTEGAYYADDDMPVEPYRSRWMRPLTSERQAAEWQVKFNTIYMAYGVVKFIYHSGTPGWINDVGPSGIFFEYDGAPRKMVATQAAMSHVFGPDVQSLGKLDASAQVWAYGFVSRGKTVIVLWNEEFEEPRAIGGAEGARVLDVLGNPMENPPKTLGATPLYVVTDREMSREQAQGLADGVVGG